MDSKKIDITSTLLEKGVDIAKDFLDKLIMPAVEETGLLIKDQMTRFRFNNQIKTLVKSKEYVEKKGISSKKISFKLLVPLLEYSGLEEDDELQDKWAILLGNMVDSEQNVENHVFPYILSQISKSEYKIVEDACFAKQERQKRLLKELEHFTKNELQIRSDLEERLAAVEKLIKSDQNASWATLTKYRSTRGDIQHELRMLKYKAVSLNQQLGKPQQISLENILGFELSNLVRLGLVNEERIPFTNSQTLEIPNEPDKSHFVVDVDLDVEYNDQCNLTDLGELFILACTEKQS